MKRLTLCSPNTATCNIFGKNTPSLIFCKITSRVSVSVTLPNPEISFLSSAKKSLSITPWNFDAAVDRAQSNENFMRRMTNKCTYLHGEDVLPQASVFYQKFNVLNQLNKLKINDKPISVELKQKLYDGVFTSNNRVTDH